MNLRLIASVAVASLLALGLWLAWLWQPERQVRRHTETFIRSVENRNWGKVERLLAQDYTDRWNHDKAFVVGSLREVFRNFIFVDIEYDVTSANATNGRAIARVQISGQGGPIAQFVVSKVNSLGAPFSFTWRKSGSWPWQWELISVDHPTLEPQGGLSF